MKMDTALGFILLCIAGSLANPIAIVEVPTTKSDAQYRLDGSIKPSDYVLSIKTYFDTDNDRAFTFDGNVTITFKPTINNLQQIVLHAEDLNISSSDVSVLTSNGARLNLVDNVPIIWDNTYNFIKLNLATALSNELTYTLTISYIGQIRNDMAGFYRSSYDDNGVKRWLGVTQFESTNARKALPCFDEPIFKATFQLSILAPSAFSTILSNTRVNDTETMSDGWVRTTFRRTPAMPTYLFAFLVSDFQSGSREDLAGKEVGIWSKPNVIGLSGVAFDTAKSTVQALGNYLAIDYYSVDSNLTFDHIAVPDFSAGAMENWGMITYREAYLIYDPAESNLRYKQQITTIIAHETAHMWFGNLVTCHWWSNIWLNEGFANYLQFFIGHVVEPTMHLEEQFVLTSVHGALAADQVEGSPPLTKEDIFTPSEISTHFGTVTYSKGGSIIRMIEHLIGTDAFKKGLNLYLEENRFGSGRPESLFSNLELAAASSYNYTTSLTDIFKSWTTQAGFPLVTISADFTNGILTFTQERFYISPEKNSSEEYLIPITLTSKSNFTGNRTTKPLFIFGGKQLNYSTELKHEWILANVEQSGFYRVNYDEHLWEMLTAALNSESFTEIPELNRAQIVDDVFALARADVLSYQKVLNLLTFLKRERSYFVWVPAVSGFNFLRGRLQISPDHMRTLDEYILDLIDGIVNELGLEEDSEDDFIKLRNRMLILELACELGHDACVQRSVKLFSELRQNGTPIPVNQRPMAYCNALKHGSHEDFQFLWKKFEANTTIMETEKLVILSTLGCSSNNDSISSFLHEIFRNDSSIRKQDSSSAFSSAIQYKPNVHYVLDYVKVNHEEIRREFSLNTVLSGLAGRFTSVEDLETFEAWLNSSESLTEAEVKSGLNAVTSLKKDFAWTEAHLDEIRSFLSSVSSAGILTSSLTLAIAAIFLIITIQS